MTKKKWAVKNQKYSTKDFGNSYAFINFEAILENGSSI